MTTTATSPALLTSSIHLLNHRLNLDSKSIVRIPIPDRQLQTKMRKISWKTNAAAPEKITDSEFEIESSSTVDIAKNLKDRGDHAAFMRIEEKLARKKLERSTYLIAALISSLGITSMAALAVYLRFSQQMEGGELPLAEMFATFALSIGAAIGMEYYARWAHRAVWHASLWHMHESHHRPRDGPFELNDVFAIINAGPAIALISYGFFNPGLIPGLCFGTGLGITVFGMAYMFVHDGLVHCRFPVGPIAQFPYLRRVAAAHHLHHKDVFHGVPFGLFLGPQELEKVGGLEELDKEIKRRVKQAK